MKKNYLECFFFPPVHVEVFCPAHNAQSQVGPRAVCINYCANQRNVNVLFAVVV